MCGLSGVADGLEDGPAGLAAGREVWSEGLADGPLGLASEREGRSAGFATGREVWSDPREGRTDEDFALSLGCASDTV